MAKQNLDGAQVGAGFQHMSCETMPQAVRRYVLGDAGTLGGLVYRLPDDLFRNRDIGPPSLHRTWEQIGLGLHPAPILAQSLQQLGGQQDIAVAGSLALANVNDHALAVDVGDLEMAHLGSAQARCIQHHHHGAMHKVAGRIDQARYLLLVKYGRQSQRPLRKWNVIGKVGPPESLDVEKAQSAGAKPNSPRRQLTIAKQMNLILPDMVQAKPLWRTMEVPRKILHRVEIATCGALGIVATLEFIQHQLPKMGHGKPPVIRGLHRQQCGGKAHAAASVAPAT